MEDCSSIYRDCCDYWILNHRTSGVYRVIPKDMTIGFDVYCEMTTDDAWLVGQISSATIINYLYWPPIYPGFVCNRLLTISCTVYL